MNSSVKEAWISEGSRGADAYEAWVDKLMTAQGADWCPGKTPPGAFSASLRHKVIGEINVIESRCDPCTGYRTERHAALVDEPTVGFYYQVISLLTDALTQYFNRLKILKTELYLPMIASDRSADILIE